MNKTTQRRPCPWGSRMAVESVARCRRNMQRGAAAFFEPVTIASCLHNVAVMGQSIHECRSHFGIPGNLYPFTEGEV